MEYSFVCIEFKSKLKCIVFQNMYHISLKLEKKLKYMKQFAFSDQISSRIPIGIAAGFAY